ncbi:MAG: fumarate reductase subunit C [Pseudomonadota bacterium]
MSRKPFNRPVSKTGWYLRHPRYLRYMSREVTCIFIGALALLMVCALERLAHGQAAYEAFVAAITGGWSALALALVLVAAVHNAISWFKVTPKALPVQIGESFLPGRYIIGAHFALWALLSAAVLWFAGVI